MGETLMKEKNSHLIIKILQYYAKTIDFKRTLEIYKPIHFIGE